MCFFHNIASSFKSHRSHDNRMEPSVMHNYIGKLYHENNALSELLDFDPSATLVAMRTVTGP